MIIESKHKLPFCPQLQKKSKGIDNQKTKDKQKHGTINNLQHMFSLKCQKHMVRNFVENLEGIYVTSISKP